MDSPTSLVASATVGSARLSCQCWKCGRFWDLFMPPSLCSACRLWAHASERHLDAFFVMPPEITVKLINELGYGDAFTR